MHAVRIAIVGDFDRARHSHWATEAALFHSSAELRIEVEPHWVPTPSVDSDETVARLSEFDGVWGAPGSPYASMAGILRAIEYARSSDVPYLGTCAGFQYALIEFTRNVLGIADADTAENDPTSKNVVITPIDCPLPERGPRFAGAGVARPVAGTLLERLCGAQDLRGEYFCNFETNAEFVPRWEAAGMRVAARGGDGELRAFELPNHRFFLASLFQPQLSSSYGRAHPIIRGFLQACVGAAH